MQVIAGNMHPKLFHHHMVSTASSCYHGLAVEAVALPITAAKPGTGDDLDMDRVHKKKLEWQHGEQSKHITKIWPSYRAPDGPRVSTFAKMLPCYQRHAGELRGIVSSANGTDSSAGLGAIGAGWVLPVSALRDQLPDSPPSCFIIFHFVFFSFLFYLKREIESLCRRHRARTAVMAHFTLEAHFSPDCDAS
jgi:hypothetical protein